MYDNAEDPMPTVENVEQDRRITLLQQYIDLERVRERIAHDRKSLAARSAKVDEEFERVLNLLHEALGMGDSMASAKKSISVAAREY